MSARTVFIPKIHVRGRTCHDSAEDPTIASRLSEIFWLSLTFGLFLALGPFSVVATVLGVMSLRPGEDADEPLPES